MEKLVEPVLGRHYGKKPRSISPLGGGFYGRVFLARMDGEPAEVVLKIYLFPNLAQREAAQLQLLSSRGTVPMPKVWFTHLADAEAPHDALAMEYMPGINAGSSRLELTEENRRRIASSIVDNLLAYHDTVHEEGFGEIGGSAFVPDWNGWYRPKAKAAFNKAKQLHEQGKLDRETVAVMEMAMSRFGSIFCIPIREARLIHGDYNTWNILLREDLTGVKAVIDPFNCCWADPELDLYQLNNANGKAYGLLDLYASRRKLSANFPLKNSFYELFTEVTHYFDAGIDTGKSQIPQQARRLQEMMAQYGI